MRARVIDLPKEGLTASALEGIINEFIERERPSDIISLDLISDHGFLVIVYRKE